MEAVAGFDHLFRIAAFLNPPFQDLHGREVIVGTVKILKSPLIKNLLVDLA